MRLYTREFIVRADYYRRRIVTDKSVDWYGHAAPTRLVRRLLGGVKTDNFRVETRRERFREAPGPATQMEDCVEALVSDTRSDDVYPEL